MLSLTDHFGRFDVAVSQYQTLDFSIASSIKTQTEAYFGSARRNFGFLIAVGVFDDVTDFLFLCIQEKDHQLDVQSGCGVEVNFELVVESE